MSDNHSRPFQATHVVQEPTTIRSGLDLRIPADFSNLSAAIAWIHVRVIAAPNALVRIMLAPGVHEMGVREEVVLRHPQGSQIHILGDVQDGSRVQVRVPTKHGQHFLAVANGYELGRLDGLTVEGVGGWLGHGAWDEGSRPYGCGVLNDGGGTVNLGPQLRIARMYYGVRAEKGGRVVCDPGVQVREAGDAGFHAYNGGHIEASGTAATACAHAAVGLGSGYLAELGGTIKADGSESSGNGLSGFGALSNGSVWAQNAKARDNGRYGFWAENQGHVVATSDGGRAEAFRNPEGFRAGKGGSVECPGALATGNSRVGFAVNAGVMDASGAEANGNGVAVSARYGAVVYGAPRGRGNAAADLVDASSVVGADPLA